MKGIRLKGVVDVAHSFFIANYCDDITAPCTLHIRSSKSEGMKFTKELRGDEKEKNVKVIVDFNDEYVEIGKSKYNLELMAYALNTVQSFHLAPPSHITADNILTYLEYCKIYVNEEEAPYPVMLKDKEYIILIAPKVDETNSEVR